MNSIYFTKISKKQIGVIFSNYKRENINISDEVINWLYNSCVEVRGYQQDCPKLEEVLLDVKAAIDSLFAGECAEAEVKLISAYNFYHVCFKTA